MAVEWQQNFKVAVEKHAADWKDREMKETRHNQGCPFDLPGRIDFVKSPFENVEGRLFFKNLPWKNGREILPSKSPLPREKIFSPFKISLWKMEGRFSLRNLPSEGRKNFLGRFLNLPSKFKIEINAFWPLEVNMDHIIWDIYQIIDIWWAIVGTVRTIIRIQNINSD